MPKQKREEGCGGRPVYCTSRVAIIIERKERSNTMAPNDSTDRNGTIKAREFVLCTLSLGVYPWALGLEPKPIKHNVALSLGTCNPKTEIINLQGAYVKKCKELQKL